MPNDITATDGRRVGQVMRHRGEHVNATLIRDGYATAIRTCSYARRRECLPLEAPSAGDGPTEAGGGRKRQIESRTQ